MLLMRANLLQGQVGGGWALEIETFGPCEMKSSRQAQIKISRAQPPPTHSQVMDLPASKALHTGLYQSEVHR